MKPKCSKPKGTKVKAVNTTAVGTVVSTKPFTVKYKYNGKTYTRFTKPKFWKKR